MISIESATGVVWGHSALELVVDVASDGSVVVRSLTTGGGPVEHPRVAQPLVEVLVAGEGRARVSHRFSETAVGRRLVYAGSVRRAENRATRPNTKHETPNTKHGHRRTTALPRWQRVLRRIAGVVIERWYGRRSRQSRSGPWRSPPAHTTRE